MPINEILTIITLHFLSDWWFQPRRMAETKSSSYIALLSHGLIIFLVFAAYALYFDKCIDLAVINAVLHVVLDRLLWVIYKWIAWTRGITKENHVNGYWFYFSIGLDQILHLWILIILFS